MRLQVSSDDVAGFYVDRASCDGFKVVFDGLIIDFESEVDAVRVAKAILDRMGESFDGSEKAPLDASCDEVSAMLQQESERMYQRYAEHIRKRQATA